VNNSAYNFLGSWQLVPEKSEYSHGVAPKSMYLKIEEYNQLLQLDWNWNTYDNEAMHTSYKIDTLADKQHPFEHPTVADVIEAKFEGSYKMQITAFKQNEIVFDNFFEINNKGLLLVKQYGKTTKNEELKKLDVYHRQLSVLPYAHSVTGVAIVPNSQGTIKHKALQAMAEQTDMHLDQIRKQIEVLAMQANEIKRRKDLSMVIYDAKINFVPQIGQIYHLYEKNNGDHTLSLVSPSDWGGGSGPYKSHLGSVKLLADHTWTEHEAIK
jgi:Protein of unknown function (DUF2452)